jgi:23S rRNA (uracil-5-)-methyltransferase RumA
MGETYPKQSDHKQEMVKNTLFYYVEAPGFVPANALEFYRNRADFWYDPTQKLGFRKRTNSYEGFSSPHCQLVSPRAQQAYQLLSQKLAPLNWEPYSVLNHTGYLRYVTFRESKTNGTLIVSLITFTTQHEKEIETLANELLQSKLVDGVSWIHYPGFQDTVDGEIFREWGETLLIEKMNGVTLSYNVRCFFQTNPKMAEKLQKHVVDLVSEKNSVLDLYCGVGLFSIPLALNGHLVKGMELSKESITFARKNAHAAGLDDDIISFEIADVPKKLQELEKNHEKFETIILDPPRSGLSKKIWRRVLRLEPKQLIYVACNLDALKRDLDWLSEYAEFKINDACAFDLFPHTPHLETVVNIRIEKIKEFPKGG